MCIVTHQSWTLCRCKEVTTDSCEDYDLAALSESILKNCPNSYAKGSAVEHGRQSPISSEGDRLSCPKYYVRYIETKGACYDDWVMVEKGGNGAANGKKKK